MATVGFGEDVAETGRAAPEQGRRKRRKAELVRDEADVQVMETTRVPELVAGTIRGKRQWVHKPAMDAKQKREAAAAAFEDMDTDKGGIHFPPWSRRSRIILWM